MTTFNVGDLVSIIPNKLYNITRGQGEFGVIKTITERWVTIIWDKDSFPEKHNLPYANDWQISVSCLKLLEPAEIDNRPPVLRKIRKLWNNSNWVKNNPSQAY